MGADGGAASHTASGLATKPLPPQPPQGGGRRTWLAIWLQPMEGDGPAWAKRHTWLAI
jgi:hypothetical protein